MIKRLFWDERGDLSFFTIFVILSINMVMAFLLLFATIRIECINIRNAAKMELNNVSARIYADTYPSRLIFFHHRSIRSLPISWSPPAVSARSMSPVHSSALCLTAAC